MTRVGAEYARYLEGISWLPFMLGWQNCGYIEQWDGAHRDSAGQEQNGFFDPFGKPLMDVLGQVKEASKKIVEWHLEAAFEE